MNNHHKEEIAELFRIDISRLERFNVLLWIYETGNYQGNAFLLLEDIETKKLLEVNAYHCSCYGLEGKFYPEDSSVEALNYRIFNGEFSYKKQLEECIKEYSVRQYDSWTNEEIQVHVRIALNPDCHYMGIRGEIDHLIKIIKEERPIDEIKKQALNVLSELYEFDILFETFEKRGGVMTISEEGH